MTKNQYIGRTLNRHLFVTSLLYRKSLPDIQVKILSA